MIPYVGTIRTHPLVRARPLAALWRIAKFQFLTRTRTEVLFPWVNGTQLAVRKNMPGASGNVYYGLHEYADMGFLIHYLRSGDLFFDVGANVGTWTVLASGVCGARTIAFEPDEPAVERLRRNVEVNRIGELVRVETVAVDRRNGTAMFSIGMDTNNRFAENGSGAARKVPVRTLDSFEAEPPKLIKIDVEGFEADVVAGARRLLCSPNLQAVVLELVTTEIHDALVESGLNRLWYDPASRTISRRPNGVRASNALYVRDAEEAETRVRTAPARSVLHLAL